MIAVVQRVKSSKVTVGSEATGEIGKGLLILLGVERGDSSASAESLCSKVLKLRIFPSDEKKPMDRSVVDVGGALLVVSQFTLAGDCTKGNRPSFDHAALPEDAEKLYEYFVDQVRKAGVPVATGRFRAMMEVSLINDGPVTFVLSGK
jgi:D-tyrosyl-tRNA(Tyr) deacylase